MRRRWTVLSLLAGAVASMVSLYLPWQQASAQERGGTVTDLLGLFARGRSVDGWTSGIGDVAALSALLLTVLAGAAFLRPELAGRLPIGVAAGFVGYFMVAVAVEARVAGERQEVAPRTIEFHYAYGSYVGLAAALVVLAAAAAMRRDEFAFFRLRLAVATAALVLALLVTFLLPWYRVGGPVPITLDGISAPAAIIAAMLALFVPLVWWQPRPSMRLALAAAVALFTAAAASSFASMGSHAYGTWLGLGLAAALGALALLDGVRVPRPARLPWQAGATAVAGALFVTAFFLPWQNACYATGSEFGFLSGRCVSANGWGSIVGAAAAVLVIALLVVTLTRPPLPVSIAELAAGIALLVTTLAAGLVEGSGSGVRFERAYGSAIGAVSAACLLGLAVTRLRRPSLPWNRVPARLLPLAACAAYLAFVFVPWWDVLPRQLESELRLAPFSWLTIAGALIAIHLFGLWTQQIPGSSRNAHLLVPLAAVLLVLAAIDLIRVREGGITWGGGIVAGLCLLLLLLGRIEQRAGLENLRVPALLRVDRL